MDIIWLFWGEQKKNPIYFTYARAPKCKWGNCRWHRSSTQIHRSKLKCWHSILAVPLLSMWNMLKYYNECMASSIEHRASLIQRRRILRLTKWMAWTISEFIWPQPIIPNEILMLCIAIAIDCCFTFTCDKCSFDKAIASNGEWNGFYVDPMKHQVALKNEGACNGNGNGNGIGNDERMANPVIWATQIISDQWSLYELYSDRLFFIGV